MTNFIKRVLCGQWAALRVASALVAMFLIANLFIVGAQPVAVGLFQEPWDKVAHAVVFAAMGVLLAMALRGAHVLHGRQAWSARQSLCAAGVLAMLVGAADEIHQMWLPGRTAAVDDWLVDALGAVVGLACLAWLWRRAESLEEDISL